MNPAIMAAVVAIVLIVMILGSDLLRTLSDERNKLTREQRDREDNERDYLKSIEQRNFEADIAASIFDPLGLFH